MQLELLNKHLAGRHERCGTVCLHLDKRHSGRETGNWVQEGELVLLAAS